MSMDKKQVEDSYREFSKLSREEQTVRGILGLLRGMPKAQQLAVLKEVAKRIRALKG